MKHVRETKSPRWAATHVLNSQIDIITEAIQENEKREKRFQEPMPLPRLDVKKMVELTKKLTWKAFEERQQEMNDGWFGNASEWEFEAMRTLRDDLKVYARKTNDADLLRQIEGVWPETKPPRDLTPEELTQLADLQAAADDIAKVLITTVKTHLERLWDISRAEADIIAGTGVQNRCIFNLVDWLAATCLPDHINTWWLFKRGGSTTPPESLRLEQRDRPKRWTD